MRPCWCVSCSLRAEANQNCTCSSTGEYHDASSSLGSRGGWRRETTISRVRGQYRTPLIAGLGLPAPQRRSACGTAMHGTALSTPDPPPRITGCQSRAHQSATVERLAYGMSLVTRRQDGWLGISPPDPPSPILLLCRGAGALKLTRRSSSVPSLYMRTAVNIFAVASPLQCSSPPVSNMFRDNDYHGMPLPRAEHQARCCAKNALIRRRNDAVGGRAVVRWAREHAHEGTDRYGRVSGEGQPVCSQ